MVKDELFLQSICLYTSFVAYFVVKFISFVVAFNVFLDINLSTAKMI